MPPAARPSPDSSATTGAAFLMATSAIGPGFLTQTAVFTSVLGADFAFAILGAVMILLTAGVVVAARPDYAAALRAAVWPGQVAFLPIVTIVGGTVGGYITFSGVHRLLDAGIGGPSDVSRLGRAASMGIVVTGLMRVLLFLAVLGVVARAGALDPANPPASAFRLGAGDWGYRIFGIVLWSAAITSVVGCSYTSLS